MNNFDILFNLFIWVATSLCIIFFIRNLISLFEASNNAYQNYIDFSGIKYIVAIKIFWSSFLNMLIFNSLLPLVSLNFMIFLSYWNINDFILHTIFFQGYDFEFFSPAREDGWCFSITEETAFSPSTWSTATYYLISVKFSFFEFCTFCVSISWGLTSSVVSLYKFQIIQLLSVLFVVALLFWKRKLKQKKI